MKTIDIGSVSIPLDSYVVGGTALLGIRESGKTYAAKGIAEQLLEYKVPIVVFDAIGVWAHLKTAAPGGKGKGYKIVVAGGKHADLPLTPASAPEIVRAAIRENIPLILDLYDEKLSKADWRRIVQKCFRTLLYENVGLRHIFLEEAAEYAPQKVFDGETYAEVEKLVRMGGNKSLGITLINQRAQELNKAVLDLCENLVLMRQRGAHAIDALERWIDKLEPDVAKQIAKAMPHMGQGEAWVFTGGADKAKLVHTAKIRSFHPDRRKPQAAGDTGPSADTSTFVERLTGELAAVLKQAEIDDPKKLRARIAELERLAKGTAGKSEVDRAYKSGYDTGYGHALEKGRAEGRKGLDAAIIQDRRALKRAMHEAVDRTLNAIEPRPLTVSAVESGTIKPDAHIIPQPARPGYIVTHPAPSKIPPKTREALGELATHARARAQALDGADLGLGPARILAALIQYPGGRTRDQLKAVSGYATRSLTTYLPQLIELGYAENRGGTLHATDAGRNALPDAEPLPTGEGLQRYWLERLPEGEKRILKVLLDAEGHPVTREKLQDLTQYATRSLTTYLPKLVQKSLAIVGKGEVRAAEELF